MNNDVWFWTEEWNARQLEEKTKASTQKANKTATADGALWADAAKTVMSKHQMASPAYANQLIKEEYEKRLGTTDNTRAVDIPMARRALTVMKERSNGWVLQDTKETKPGYLRLTFRKADV